MIRKLTKKDRRIVLDFAYRRERENLFVIGSFNLYKKSFEANHFFGYFRGRQLIGLATSFGRYGSFVVNARNKKVVEALTDHTILAGIKIPQVPCFEPYGSTIVNCLNKKHRIKAKEIKPETVLILKKGHFKDFSVGGVKHASKKDIDEIIRFDRKINGINPKKPIQTIERQRINPKENFILKIKGKIVSQADIHGVSKNYFQIGGVGTEEAHRGKGYAKQVVSALCRYYFKKGLSKALLFTANTNKAAKKVYAALGFKPAGKFIIARY